MRDIYIDDKLGECRLDSLITIVRDNMHQLFSDVMLKMGHWKTRTHDSGVSIVAPFGTNDSGNPTGTQSEVMVQSLIVLFSSGLTTSAIAIVDSALAILKKKVIEDFTADGVKYKPGSGEQGELERSTELLELVTEFSNEHEPRKGHIDPKKAASHFKKTVNETMKGNGCGPLYHKKSTKAKGSPSTKGTPATKSEMKLALRMALAMLS